MHTIRKLNIKKTSRRWYYSVTYTMWLSQRPHGGMRGAAGGTVLATPIGKIIHCDKVEISIDKREISSFARPHYSTKDKCVASLIHSRSSRGTHASSVSLEERFSNWNGHSEFKIGGKRVFGQFGSYVIVLRGWWDK